MSEVLRSDNPVGGIMEHILCVGGVFNPGIKKIDSDR